MFNKFFPSFIRVGITNLINWSICCVPGGKVRKRKTKKKNH